MGHRNTGRFPFANNFPGNSIGKLMEHDFLGSSSGKFPGETELLRSPVFPVGMFQKEISLPFTNISSIIPVPGL